MIVTITHVEQAFTKNGAEYCKVTGVDGQGKETTKSVFDNLKDKWGLLKENATLDFTMEKKGQFWNVTSITPIADKIPEPVKPTPIPSPLNPLVEAVKEIGATVIPDTMTKGDWADKDRITRKSIERQTALNAAVKMAENLSHAEIEVFKINQKTGNLTVTSDKVIATAKLFENYLEKG